jgi:hypothetical protein
MTSRICDLLYIIVLLYYTTTDSIRTQLADPICRFTELHITNFKTMEFLSFHHLTDLQLNWLFNILFKSSLASLLEHDAHRNFNFLKKIMILWFGLKWNSWIDNPNPKSDLDFVLSFTIQSTKWITIRIEQFSNTLYINVSQTFLGSRHTNLIKKVWRHT